MSAIVLFDGVCNLCSGAVQFIVERDPRARFKFASIQSDSGKELMREHGIAIPSGDPTSIVLVEDGRAFQKSSAAVRIARGLRFPWSLLAASWIVPRFVRDWVYGIVARNRYRWFGKKEVCMVPTPELRARFL